MNHSTHAAPECPVGLTGRRPPTIACPSRRAGDLAVQGKKRAHWRVCGHKVSCRDVGSPPHGQAMVGAAPARETLS